MSGAETLPTLGGGGGAGSPERQEQETISPSAIAAGPSLLFVTQAS
jgi:hypothetical protein